MTSLLLALLAATTLLFGGTPSWATSLFEAGVLFLCVPPVIAAVKRPDAVRLPPSALVLMLVPVWALAQRVLGIPEHPSAFWTETGLSVSWAALYASAVWAFQRRPTDRDRFLTALAVFGGAAASLAILGFAVSRSRVFGIVAVRAGEPMGPFVNRDHWAVFAELVIPVAMFLAVRSRSWLSWPAVAVAALFVSVVVSGSRAGTAGALASVAITAAASRRKGLGVRRFAAALAAIAVIGAGLLAATGLGRMPERLRLADPLGPRAMIWTATAQMIAAKPATGWGMGMYQTIYPQFAVADFDRIVDHAHSDWAEWTVEGGAPLLILMIAFVGLTAKAAFRSIWGTGCLVAFAHALVDFPFRIPALAALVIVLLAAVESQKPSRPRRTGPARALVIDLEPDWTRTAPR